MENLNLTMFKQYDIRTRYKALTEEHKRRLYNAVALYIRDSVKAKSVIIEETPGSMSLSWRRDLRTCSGRREWMF